MREHQTLRGSGEGDVKVVGASTGLVEDFARLQHHHGVKFKALGTSCREHRDLALNLVRNNFAEDRLRN